MRWSKDNSVRINTDFQTNPKMDKTEAERLRWTKSKVQTQEGCPSEPSRKNSGTESKDTEMRMNDHTCISVTCAAVTPEVSREPPARGLELKQVSSTPNPPAGRVSSSPRTHWAAPAPLGSGSSPLRRPGGRPLRLRQPSGPEAALGPPEPGPALSGGASAPTDPALPAVWGPLPPGRARLHTKSTKPSVATTHSPSSHPRLCLRKRLRATRTLWRHFRRARVTRPGTPSPGVPRAPCWGRRREGCEPVVGVDGVLGGREGGPEAGSPEHAAFGSLTHARLVALRRARRGLQAAARRGAASAAASGPEVSWVEASGGGAGQSAGPPQRGTRRWAPPGRTEVTPPFAVRRYPANPVCGAVFQPPLCLLHPLLCPSLDAGRDGPESPRAQTWFGNARRPSSPRGPRVAPYRRIREVQPEFSREGRSHLSASEGRGSPHLFRRNAFLVVFVFSGFWYGMVGESTRFVRPFPLVSTGESQVSACHPRLGSKLCLWT